MKILLIDVDSTIPNLALMKISSYYKSFNSDVELLKLHIPYYPNRKKRHFYINTESYDLVYASVVFTGNHNYVIGDNIIFGGTGYDPKVKLPSYIDNCECDYTLYNDLNKTYDFITRGCIRKCYFCFVPEKEGYLHKVKDVSLIIEETLKRGYDEIMFLDNNILAYDDHINVLNKLIDSKLKIDLNQGLDLRLLNDVNQDLLSKLRYKSEYIFAFDNWKYKNMVDEKLHLLKRFGDYKVKLYIYVDPNMKLDETIKRIVYCKSNKLLPYIMRDISCFNDVNKNFYTDIASYCNQPNFFKKLTFEQFLIKRHVNKDRINKSLKLWNGCDLSEV